MDDGFVYEYPGTDDLTLKLARDIYAQARYRQHVGKAVIDSQHREAEMVWPKWCSNSTPSRLS